MSERSRAQEEAAALAARLSRTTAAIDRIIAEVAASTETSGTYWRNVEVRLRRSYEDLRAITRAWLDAKLPQHYNVALADQVRRLKARAVKPPRIVDFKTIVRSLTVRQTLASLLSETISSFNTGFTSGEATLLRLARSTQQVNLSEKKVNRLVEQGFAEEATAQGSKRKLRDALLKKAVEGKYVSVVDRNGDTRQYNVASYAELVARTKLIEAASQATISTATEVGSDLVQVSAHNTNCAVCAPYEGKIFSISGADPRFPALDAEPPFHPQCEHSLTVVVEEALALDGTLEKYIAFSNDEAGEHPTRAGFIPVAERELA